MDKYFIVRTAWLYGYVGKNFVKTMLNLAKSHDHVTVVHDQLGNPTSANDLAYEILKLALTDNYGIYHVTNEGTCLWSDFATAIMYGAHTGCEVIPCTSEEYKQKNPASADRPAFLAWLICICLRLLVMKCVLGRMRLKRIWSVCPSWVTKLCSKVRM